MKAHVFRLHAGQQLREEIDLYVQKNNIHAGVIVTCVGNVTKAVLRMAGGKTTKVFDGSFEILSLVGTLEAGNSHLHLCISDADGNVFGGHLRPGSIVGVTAEVAIGEIENVKFSREFDSNSGYDELVIRPL